MTSDTLTVGFRTVLDAIADGVYVTDDQRQIVFWSAGAERITGYPADEVVGKHCYDDLLVHTDLRGTNLCVGACPLQDSIDSGCERAVSEVFLKHRDGRRIAVYVKATRYESEGRTFGVEVFGELASVAGKELAAQVQELSDSAVTDALSGLFNRRYFDATLAQQFALYDRLGRRYGVIHLDVDNLKEINDTLGHAGGDAAIRFVAGILSASARKMDVAARYGGDEFTLLCALGTQAELETSGRRLVNLVRGSRFAPGEAAGLRLTISAGGSLVNASDADERQALERADKAMYRAKRGGRNEFVSSSEGEG